ncbi:hypothetical protein AYX14_03140 [Cryptococcus neoformans]|nr:hypothetical protein AYX15_02345 [Cryptococcus neoformans var. grubii]OWZ77317.1 ethanolaminephosphotransferase [Cryptococcus neoformans var. grubii Bt85]OXG16134.1 ethanolaminephosphotransferase [Cryptococcus neoformans var. grubii Tu401-1]OXM78389.1 ethanolaminephosphotransferase [Cryptococcus neoformans var. grubii Bt63]OWZ71468.1 hypothetical protein AYX14_03140 [Cryptococcus neoformans var. grubii]
MRITKAQFTGLDAYKYSGIDKSVVSKYILGPFWAWLVTLFPKNIAPNTITFIGLCFVFTNVGTLLFFDPLYEGAALPSWAYFSFAFGLFAYQSMDAIDGKQARRTGMASALGEMFDHGCDAINTTLEVILASHALGLNQSWWTVASQVASLCNFYVSTWEEYHTGTLYLSAFSGPVEGILLIVGIYIITAIHPLGSAFWSQPLLKPVLYLVPQLFPYVQKVDGLLESVGVWKYVRLESIPANVAFMSFGAVGTLANIVTSYHNVITSRRKAGKPIFPPLFGLLPFFTHTTILLAWLHAESKGGVCIVHDSRMLPFLGYWGMAFSYQVSQLILAHVTKSSFPYWNGMMIFSLFGAADANMGWLFGREPLVQSSPVAANVFIWMSFVVALFNYVRFAREVIWQICEYTGLACFTVRHKDENGKWVQNGKKMQ